jgi:predicted DNA-binding protein (UPF0251 family)
VVEHHRQNADGLTDRLLLESRSVQIRDERSNRLSRTRPKATRYVSSVPAATSTRAACQRTATSTPVRRVELQEASHVERLAYSRKQAAETLGVSIATIDRRVVPTIDTVKTPWGQRLIPVDELERFLDQNIESGRPADRVPTAHGGRRWWPSTVRAVLRASA